MSVTALTLLALLSDSRWQTALVLHANHSREISDELVSRCQQWRREGITLLNQSVLLAGVNDSVATLEALSDRLHEAGVMPYYLHQLDTTQCFSCQ